VLGILLIDKRRGCSSHDVVDAVRRRLQTRRVGHAGTLDPLASGLLVVAVGPATRFLQYLPLEPKVYVGDFTFGVETSTMDAEGEIVAQKDPPPDLEGQILEAIPAFTGLIQQLPPMFSAVKKDGKPLYAYARAGQEVERKPRTVHIGSIEPLGVDGPVATLRVVCSGGTYVRTLANDLGRHIGCGAHLSGLRREAVGKFHVEDALAPDEAAASRIIPLKNALPPVPVLQVDAEQVRMFREGRQVELDGKAGQPLVALAGPSGEVFGIARTVGTALQPECVIPAEAVDG
jgi:tRNA pseudouridine55 synthase